MISIQKKTSKLASIYVGYNISPPLGEEESIFLSSLCCVFVFLGGQLFCATQSVPPPCVYSRNGWVCEAKDVGVGQNECNMDLYGKGVRLISRLNLRVRP